MRCPQLPQHELAQLKEKLLKALELGTARTVQAVEDAVALWCCTGGPAEGARGEVLD